MNEWGVAGVWRPEDLGRGVWVDVRGPERATEVLEQGHFPQRQESHAHLCIAIPSKMPYPRAQWHRGQTTALTVRR